MGTSFLPVVLKYVYLCLFYLWNFFRALSETELMFLICISNAIIDVFMCFYKYFIWESRTYQSSLYESQRKLFYHQHTMHEIIANITIVTKYFLDQKKIVYGYIVFSMIIGYLKNLCGTWKKESFLGSHSRQVSLIYQYKSIRISQFVTVS